MGIRPKIMTVFGIDNFVGDVADDNFWYGCAYIPQDEIVEHPLTLAFVKDYCFDCVKDEWKWYPDVLYFGNHNSGGRGIAGLKLSYSYESRTFRALSMLYPEFMQPGYRDIPLEPPDEQEFLRLRFARGIPIPSCDDIEFRDKWFYPQGYWKLAPQWAYVTRWLFNSIGIETNVDDYKWMLVWEWS